MCSAAHAADVLKLSVRTVLRRANSGDLPVLGKLDGPTGSYVLDLDAVEALAQERTR